MGTKGKGEERIPSWGRERGRGIGARHGATQCRQKISNRQKKTFATLPGGKEEETFAKGVDIGSLHCGIDEKLVNDEDWGWKK